MSFQQQSLGSFDEPKEVSRTFYWYNQYPRHPVNIKRRIHKEYHAMLIREGLIRGGGQ